MIIETKDMSNEKIKKLLGKKLKVTYISRYQITVEVGGETILIVPNLIEGDDFELPVLEFEKIKK